MKAFFAYPGGERSISDAVSAAAEFCKTDDIHLTPWETLKIIGFKIDDLIREKIYEAEVLIADVTYDNHNVYYEIGYAIATGKLVLPTVYSAIKGSASRIQRVGLFDTIGWLSYENSIELSEKIGQWENSAWASNYVRKRDYVQPLFVLDTQIKTDFRNHIFNTISNSSVNYRSFDPTEVPRLSAPHLISEVSSSAGVVVQVLRKHIVGAHLNNLRASFILGLCHGYEINALAIQYENGPVPLDYRNFITNSTFKKETEKHVEEFCSSTLVWNQVALSKDRQRSVGILNEIDLGSPTAENEIQHLKQYFVKTAEFSRALRAEGAIIIGRKGSGKTAVYLQVSETILRDRRVCVVDLRPASHNLSEMREALLEVLSAGVFDHTIAAFWQYTIYIEILLKIRDLALPRSKNDFELQERIRTVEDSFDLQDTMVSGDFTSRLEAAVKEVIRVAEESQDSDRLREQLTNIMFEKPIRRLREVIEDFSDQYDHIVVLIDDLDKGWPPLRVENHDIAMVKHLIEVLNRIQRDLAKQEIVMKHLLFLRSDIYETLIEQTSDRGKYNLIAVDWSDPEQLRFLIKERIESNFYGDRIEEAWNSFNQTLGADEKVIDRLIGASLRRPRFLIDLCERTLSFAINRGHQLVTEDDVDEGLRQMSLYLVSDFGYEMRDVSGTPEDIFYLFIGMPEKIKHVQLVEVLETRHIGLSVGRTIDLLLWYGFLGVETSSENPVFIYDRAYDFRRLMAEIPNDLEDATYFINIAFLRGLN